MRETVQESEQAYGLTLERRAKAVITGVTEVESFDEEQIVLQTHGGRLTLSGSGLHVSSLALDDGKLMLQGTVNGLNWDGVGPRKRGLLQRILK